jgi:hypothetical protein
MTIGPKLFALGILAIAGAYVGPADAATRYGNCRWDGTSPFCEGRCPSGFVARKYKACFSGWKVYCCEPMGSVSQSQRRR